MPNILILGGGAAGLAAALAAAQSAPAAQVIVLERNPKPGKKLLATGNGRCNLDNTGIAPELYFTADPAALRPLLDAVNTADPLRWFRALGLYTRTDEAGRVYPYSNQAADVLALLDETDSGLDVDALSTVSHGMDAYRKSCDGSMLIITHNTRILEHLDVDRVHVMVKGHIVREDDASLIPWIDKNGFETFEREAAEQRAQAEAAAAEQQA